MSTTKSLTISYFLSTSAMYVLFFLIHTNANPLEWHLISRILFGTVFLITSYALGSSVVGKSLTPSGKVRKSKLELKIEEMAKARNLSNKSNKTNKK